MKSQRKPDAEATRQRLLRAAKEEFARFGIAGARVDRISENARANKAQIYHYFGSKNELFDAVFGEIHEGIASELPMDVENLPEYAGKLFDGLEAHPEVGRLMTWYRLEFGEDNEVIRVLVESYERKVSAISEAQRAGKVAATHSPEALLGLIMHTATMWISQTPEFDKFAETMSVEERREVVVSAVRSFV